MPRLSRLSRLSRVSEESSGRSRSRSEWSQSRSTEGSGETTEGGGRRRRRSVGKYGYSETTTTWRTTGSTDVSRRTTRSGSDGQELTPTSQSGFTMATQDTLPRITSLKEVFQGIGDELTPPTLSDRSLDFDQNAESDTRSWSQPNHYLAALLALSLGSGTIPYAPVMMFFYGSLFPIACLLIFVLFTFPVRVAMAGLGQLNSRTPLHVYHRLCPAFTGLGIAINIVQAVAVFSFTSFIAIPATQALLAVDSPWRRCSNASLEHRIQPWNTHACYTPAEARACLADSGANKAYYARHRCYRSDRDIQDFLWLLNDCLRPRSPQHDHRGLECEFQLRFHLNRSTPAQIFDLEPSDFDNGTLDYFKTSGFFLGNLHCKPARIAIRDWFTVPEKEGWQVVELAFNHWERPGAAKRANATWRLLSPHNYQNNCRYADNDNDDNKPVSRLGCLIMGYCQRTYEDQPSDIACLRRVLQPLHSLSAVEIHDYLYYRRGLNLPDSKAFGHLFPWQSFLGIALVWSATWWIAKSGLRNIGPCLRPFVAFSLIIITLQIFVSLFIDGQSEGLGYFFRWKSCSLNNPNFWLAALWANVHLSNTATYGVHTSLASFNRFHTDLIADNVVAGLFSLGLSVVTAVPFASLLGYLAKQMDTSIDDMLERGITPTALIFAVLGQGASDKKAGQLISTSILLFCTLVMTLTNGIQLALWFQSLVDQWPRLANHRPVYTGLIALGSFLLSISLLWRADGSLYLAMAIDGGIHTWTGVATAFALLTLVFVYGSSKFLDDLAAMMDSSRAYWSQSANRVGQRWLASRVGRGYFFLTWFLAPIGGAFLTYRYVHAALHYNLQARNYLGIILLVPLPVAFFYNLCCRRVHFSALLTPTRNWGPPTGPNRIAWQRATRFEEPLPFSDPNLDTPSDHLMFSPI